MNSEDFLPFSNSKNLLQKLFFVHSMHTEGPFGLVSFEFGGKTVYVNNIGESVKFSQAE